MTPSLFDTWIDKYDNWFETPSGQLIKKYESALLLELLAPFPGEKILDVGCGTGIFTQDVLDCGALVTGIDLSRPMLSKAIARTGEMSFTGVCADMCALPFSDNAFDKVFSMTAIEFVTDASKAVAELDRVTGKGGCVVVTTLNSLSPWAEQRNQKAKNGHSLFQNICFRSPNDMRQITPENSLIKTAIHFQKDDPVSNIPEIERSGRRNHPETGAFLAVQWNKA